MHPEKCLRVTKHGLKRLQDQILPLKAKLFKLHKAHTKLSNMRYEADLELATITTIPMGVTKKKQEEEDEKLLKAIQAMPEEEREKIIKQLEEKSHEKTQK